MSLSRWMMFFKEAGIPSASAKNYASIFEDNRISTDMLIDLDKEILREMGIKIMGDIISILKYAKKMHNQELKIKDSVTTSSKSAVKVAPISHTNSVTGSINTSQSLTKSDDVSVQHSVSAPVDVKQWRETQHTTEDNTPSEVQYTTATYQKKLAKLNESENVKDVRIPPLGSLHSDRIQLKQDIKEINPSPEKPVVLEEYTTATYEARLKKKRTSSHPTVVKTSKPSPEKQSRVIRLPSPEKKHHLDDPVERSKRLLEAAGIFGNTEDSHVFPLIAPKQSVFSRLELPKNSQTSNPSLQSSGKPKGNIKSRLGKRVTDNGNKSDEQLPPTKLYSEQQKQLKHGSVHERLGPKGDSQETKKEPVLECTMVADSVSKHSDVHARLKKKGITLPTVTKGPLGERLGQHAVFGRLE